MELKKKKRSRKINYEIKRVYVGKKPIEEVFEDIIEHVVERNLEKINKRKRKYWLTKREYFSIIKLLR